jgi:SAM-dependent methyltransferase
MHPGMSWWTEQSIGWFERASAACDYHRQLVSVVERHLRPGDRIVEFGCGLGYEAQILHDDGYYITAYDKAPEAIREAENRTGLDIFRCADVDDVDDKADVLLCINFGHLETEDDFRRLAAHSSGRIVYIISRHNGHGQDTRPDRTEQVRSILDRCGVTYSEEEIKLEFNQPLVSMEEAREFIAWTYLGKNTDAYLKYIVESDDGTYPFLFLNRKSLVLFFIGGKE